MALSGPIKTFAPWGAPYGVEWAQINRWDEPIRAAAAEFGVPEVERIKAHVVIESQGVSTAIQKNDANGWSFGLMQVVPRWWSALILRLANRDGAGLSERAIGQLLIDDPALAVRAGTAVLRAMFDSPDAAGDWDRASSKFFLGNPNWNGGDPISGTIGATYRATLHGLIAEQQVAADGPQLPTLLSQVQLPVGVTEADLRNWFGDQFNPNGQVTIVWAKEGARTGCFPRLERFDPPGAVRTFEFAGGLKIRADQSGVRVLRVTG